MAHRIYRLTLLAGAALALVGCSQLEKIGIHMPGERAEYESSTSRSPLEIPPDLDAIDTTDRFTIPGRPRAVSANAQSDYNEAVMRKLGSASGNVLPQTVTAKVIRDGQTRYVHVTASADRVWPVLQDFWPSVGLEVKTQNAQTGVMQTEWAENKANLPKDIIRATLGKVFDFVYDTGLRDQFRARMERNDDGSTDIYITHKQMVEVLAGKDADSTIWQPGPSDPQLEAEMLSRLALKLETEFNPDIKSEVAQKAAREEIVKQTEPVCDLIKDEDGKAVELIIHEPFDRAWRRAGLAMDRAGFNMVDRDRSRGIYLVSYLDSDYEAKKKAERGFFSNMFNKDQPVEAPEYRIRLAESDGQTRLTVTASDGKADTTGAAPKILVVLAEQLR
ncbi:MAG TPA: hypothetical protein DD376_00520 [Sutterella sp.]|nr:hypothetical protein [Sutterella sp.]